MLMNDQTTVAAEVPVWFWEKSYSAGISGHIDILQVRRGNIYVLDYKPEAEKEKKAPAQLLQYVRGLLFRTGLPMDYFRCAWFDGKYYYEFDPNKLFQISTVPDPD